MELYERDLLNNYDVAEVIGKGSFGEVCRAVHRETRKTVALKKIANVGKNLLSHLREIKMMKRCKDAKNVVEIFGSEIVGDDLWICMELCATGSLFDVMQLTQCNFSEQQIAFICLQTLEALTWMSENNIVHRDVKPHNLFVTTYGSVRLGDFGISRDLGPSGLVQDMIGSLLYLAPEVARQHPYSSKVDIWSLGITAIELAQGYAPRNELTSDELLRTLISSNEVPFFDHPERFSPCFLDFITSCLSMNPSSRPAARQLLAHPFLNLAAHLQLESLAEQVSTLISLHGSYAAALQAAQDDHDYLNMDERQNSSISASLTESYNTTSSAASNATNIEKLDESSAESSFDIILPSSQYLQQSPVTPRTPRIMKKLLETTFVSEKDIDDDDLAIAMTERKTLNPFISCV